MIKQVERYQYKRKKKRRAVSTRKPVFVSEPEQLSGQVMGIPAAEGEERFAKALSRLDRNFRFRINPTGVPKGMPGWLELDFLVDTLWGFRAIEIDNMEFVHRGIREEAETVIKDNKRREGLAYLGINVKEIEHVDEALLNTQEGANQVVRRMYL